MAVEAAAAAAAQIEPTRAGGHTFPEAPVAGPLAQQQNDVKSAAAHLKERCSRVGRNTTTHGLVSTAGLLGWHRLHVEQAWHQAWPIETAKHAPQHTPHSRHSRHLGTHSGTDSEVGR